MLALVGTAESRDLAGLFSRPVEVEGAGVAPGGVAAEYQRGLALAGGVVGALMGSLLWGLIGKATGFELKYGSALIGALAGLGVLLMGRARGSEPALLGAAFATLGLIIGKVLHSLWVLGPVGLETGAMVRYHTTAIDFVFLFVAASVDAFIPAGDRVRGLIRKITRRGG
jgi:hypothetical protein